MRRILIIAVLLITTLGITSAYTAAFAHDETISIAATDLIVTFNTQSKKYHCPTCSAARHCTRNCVNITRSEAQRRGGVACKRCKGTCR